MTTHRWLGLLAASVVGALACADVITAPDPAFIGTFHVTRVDGQPLPFLLSTSGGLSISITADTLTLHETGAWSEAWVTRTTETGSPAFVLAHADSGSWARRDGDLTLKRTSDATVAFKGTFGRDTIALKNGTHTYMFVP